MEFKVLDKSHWHDAVDLLVLTYRSDGLGELLSQIDHELGGAIQNLHSEGVLSGKVNESMLIHTLGQFPAKQLLLIGQGCAPLRANDLRSVAGIAVKEAKRVRAKSMAIAPFQVDSSVTHHSFSQALVEGVILGAYRFKGYSTAEQVTDVLQSVNLLLESPTDQHACGVRCGTAYADGTILARDLMNTPGNKMTPTNLAHAARDIAERHGFLLEVLERSDMERFGMGALLAVAQGSVELPKMIVLKYSGNPQSDDVLAYVGKGITFDTGGISLKSADGMDDMKMDMGGAAAVLGAMEAVGRLKPSVNIVAVVAATENMPSGSAYKPGDVLTAMGGKTIEVLNTDAEGRLVLADAVGYAKHLGATHIIDLATLTGAVVVALGSITTAAMTNSDTFLSTFLDAAKRTGEKVWQLPTFDEYKKFIKSDIADVKNLGSGGAGSITAGLFIEKFVGDTPWIHLDIAGTAWTKEDLDFTPKGASGVMVRTLAQYAKQYGKR